MLRPFPRTHARQRTIATCGSIPNGHSAFADADAKPIHLARLCDIASGVAAEIGKLEGEIAVLRADLIAAIKPPLSKEQLEKLKQPPRRPQGRPQQARPQQGRPSPDRPQRPPAERKSLDELIKRGDGGGGARPPSDRVPQRPPREPKPE